MSLSDRDMAVIFKKDAADYIRAVFELGCDEDSIRLVAPTYFMRSHAIELLLKACLLANGWTVRECKEKLGHRLNDALASAETCGLVVSENTKSVIATLSPLHEDYTFRYRPSRPYAFPNATVATKALDELFTRVHVIVQDKLRAVDTEVGGD
jgi:hypothetical protein